MSCIYSFEQQVKARYAEDEYYAWQFFKRMQKFLKAEKRKQREKA